MEFSNLSRNEIVAKLETENYDLLIIGGGITGAGIALDAVSRGLKTALVEMQDFAAGTSSRSTKLVHGGLRYLKQLEVKMVAEVGHERKTVYENGPHVTIPEKMLLPIHRGGTFGKFSTSIGLKVYDFLAGVEKTERRVMLDAKETLLREPLLKKNGLKGSGLYVEYRTDDARLTIEVIKEAASRGVTAANYAKVIELLYEHRKISGCKVEDLITGRIFTVKASKIVNAAGPWVDTIREIDKSKKGKMLKLSKGVHLVFDQSTFPLKQAVYFDVEDGRMVFAIPRSGKTYVGTTDTFFDGNMEIPTVTEADRNYLLGAIHNMFPGVKVSQEDIESSWAGVRPLIYEEGKDPSEISRKDEIWSSDSGLISIAGGKLTGYRKMAETAVDLIATQLNQDSGIKFGTSITKEMPISGGHVGGSANFQAYLKQQTNTGIQIGLPEKEAMRISELYGSNAPIVFALFVKKRDEAEKWNLPSGLFAMLVYAVEHEMAATPIDFFFRRTGSLLFNIEEVKLYKEQVLNYFSSRFGWETETMKLAEQKLTFEIINATKSSREELL